MVRLHARLLHLAEGPHLVGNDLRAGEAAHEAVVQVLCARSERQCEAADRLTVHARKALDSALRVAFNQCREHGELLLCGEHVHGGPCLPANGGPCLRLQALDGRPFSVSASRWLAPLRGFFVSAKTYSNANWLVLAGFRRRGRTLSVRHNRLAGGARHRTAQASRDICCGGTS